MDETTVRGAIQQHGIDWVRLEATDLDGVVRGKRVSTDRFLADLEGSPITDIQFGMSIGEDYYENTSGPWREGILGDMLLVPDLATFRPVPWEPRVASVICDWRALSGGDVGAAPRTVLAQQVAHLDALGLGAKVAVEYEFFLARDGRPVFEGKRCNDMLRSAEQHELLGPVIDEIVAFGVPVEEVKVESAAGQAEVTVPPAGPVEACDRVTRLKLFLKELLRPRGITASFMARPPGVEFGSSSHVHVSLWDGDEPRFPALMDHAIGGLIETMKPLAAVFNPTVNSGKRLVDLSAAPVAVSWGYENKSTALRTVTRSPQATRIEHRLAGADSNPYLVVAAILAGIRHGLEEKIEPPPAKTFFAWRPFDKDLDLLPTTLAEATDLMEQSDLPKRLLAPVFVDHFVATRRWELQKYEEDPNDEWETKRYFDRV